MKEKWLFFGFSCMSLIACLGRGQDAQMADRTSNQLYYEADNKVMEMQYDSAMVLLKQAYEKGIESPMQIVTDSRFYALIDHPEYRPQIRALLQAYAVEDSAGMVRTDEYGSPIVVKGRIVDEQTTQPLKGVQTELVHTDHEGLYFKEQSLWNPRIFAYLITMEKGIFSVSTIRPGSYEDDNGNPVPAHIHFTLTKEGYRTFAGEFTFEDDPILMTNGNTDGVLVARLVEGTENEYLVEIPMQRE